MPKFAANLHYLFAEVPFLDRFEAAARAGFKGVEFQVPYDFPKEELRKRLDTYGLQMVLFDAPMGDWNKGDRGMTCVPGREAEFRASLEKVVEYGTALGCETVHVMAGVVGPGMDYETCKRTYIANLRHAAAFLEPHGIHVVIEPINKRLGIVTNGPSYTTQGMHGYFLNHTADARAAIDAVNHPNLSLHLDCYHMQMLEGNLADTLRENVGRDEFLAPLIATAATGNGATGDPPLPVLPAGNPMTLSGVTVRSDAIALVDGQPVAATLTCQGGTFTPVFCSSNTVRVTLAAIPANGTHLLQLQNPKAALSNELPFCVGPVAGCL